MFDTVVPFCTQHINTRHDSLFSKVLLSTYHDRHWSRWNQAGRGEATGLIGTACDEVMTSRLVILGERLMSSTGSHGCLGAH